MVDKIYNFEGVEYYYRNGRWYYAKTDLHVPYAFASKLDGLFSPNKAKIAYERIIKEYPLTSECYSPKGLGGGLPGTGKKK